VSQATGKRPSARLKARREKSIPGYFANPINSVQTYKGFTIAPKDEGYAYKPSNSPVWEHWSPSLAKAKKHIASITSYTQRKKNPLDPKIQKVGRKIVHFRYLVETR
jgi:hypothetical protein